MSFKIFTLQLTGQFRRTEKIESDRRNLEKEYQAFLDAERSRELELYNELNDWIKSGDYERKKREVEAEVFKGSAECNQLREFRDLEKNSSLRKYFKVASSADLKRFVQTDSSAKMETFRALKDFVEEGSYRQQKAEAESHKYEGSVEQHKEKELIALKKNKAIKAFLKLNGSQALQKHQQFARSPKLTRFSALKNAPEKDKAARSEYRQLKRDPEIRQYFRMEGSTELRHYREMSGGHLPARYDELMKETGSEIFRKKVEWLKDAKKFEKSEAYGKFLKYRELSRDPDIVFHGKFEKSSLYRNYLDMKESFQLERFNELKQLTQSPDFIKRKAYLEDQKKWEKTEEYARYQKYEELKKHPSIVLYHKYLNSKAFDFFKEWETAFSDRFEQKGADLSRWTPNSFWGDRLLGDNFSQQGDLQAYTGGRNTLCGQGKMVIAVKKEKTSSKQWIPHSGFVPAEFNYTSDTWSTANSFRHLGGIIEAKVRFNPVRQVVSSLHLLGENNAPQVTLVEMGPASRMGILTRDAMGKVNFSGIEIGNLKKGVSYLFRLEWNGPHFIWKINERTVFETTFHHFDFAAHIGMTSLVVDEIPSSLLPVNFETDWITWYKKR